VPQVLNSAKQRLSRNELAVGIGVRGVRGVEIAGVMKTAGFDWLFIDLEHGAAAIETAASISIAALGVGIAPLVRVPQMQLTMGTRALDSGALGIVMPHVDTVEEARAIVDAYRFRPLGHRSIGGAYPQFGFAPTATEEVVKSLNDATMLVAMVETPRAVENAAKIAAVPGIDALLVGTNDLCLEMDIPGQLDDPRTAKAIDTVIAACKQHGKWPGLGGVYGKELLGRYIERGMRLILAGNDISLLLGAAKDQAAFVRGCR
jgi:2-keto-3-deoxy-L-rhamnonate aldolase RhmA